MSKKIYLTGIEQKRGKSFISTALAASLIHANPDIRCYKLFDEKDKDQFQLLSSISQQDIKPLMSISEGIQRFREQPDDLLCDLIDFLNQQEQCPVSYFEGSDFQSDNDMTEFQFNLSIAAQLNCEVILVISGKDRSFSHIETLIKSALEMSHKNHARVLGVILNQISPDNEAMAIEHFQSCFSKVETFVVIPEFEELAHPSVDDISHILKAKVLFGQNEIKRQVRQFTVAAKTLNNFLQSRSTHKDVLIITPDDRIDILLGALLADQSSNYPKVAGIALTGGEMPSETVRSVISGLEHPFPVLLTPMQTYEAATTLFSARFTLSNRDMNKVHKAVDTLQPLLAPLILQILEKERGELNLTPTLFLNDLLNKAKSNKQRIVLPEGHDPRILQAADYLLKRQIVNLTILGEKETISQLCKRHNLSLPGVKIIDIEKDNDDKNRYAKQYFKLRKHKNINEPIALERMSDVNYFAAMMVYFNDANGMVSGAVHTTADTVRPALEIIKTKPGINKVSSIFIMCLPTRIVIYGDCAINPEPDSETLAEIASQAANISQRLGLEPRVALLSYSSGKSGKGASVEKVREAMDILHNNKPDLLAEGPIQYDAAVDKDVAEKKLPDSKVAGRANVLIFPDLNTGNNTYKAVQRETGALAIGPVLLGLNKPVNDLSRGCMVQDIINTILITAIQAQEQHS